MNAYQVQLGKPIKMEALGHHFSGKETHYIVVVAGSFEAALAAVRDKYSDADIRGISLMNYEGLPVVVSKE